MLDSEDFQVIQIQNVTSRVRYQNITGEKNLLQMINACVSHEMRNPINSIQCQNYKIEQLIKTIVDLTKGNDIRSINRLKEEIG